jgi:hypothetical protein
MPTVFTSLWLPIGRANFFNVPTDYDLLFADGDTCAAGPGRKSALQVSAMRRALEVLPDSFGYDRQGRIRRTNDQTEDGRPVQLFMRLDPLDPDVAIAEAEAAAANHELVMEGVSEVTLSIDENGFYSWGATGTGSTDSLQKALDRHVQAVFGGDFSLKRHSRKRLSGEEAVRLYNGRSSTGRAGSPRGILTFFQLNTLFEGLINETLTPAVFFEDYDFLERWLSGAAKEQRTASEFIALIKVSTDATTDVVAQMTVIKHFLAVTSRESLQKLKWSIESVRRSLLDEMLGVLHRQSRLSQLNLAAVERTPEQVTGANESQLRGFVMLAAAKLPLVLNVQRYVKSTVGQLKAVLQDGPDDAAEVEGTVADTDNLKFQLQDLEWQMDEWVGLVDAVNDNVRGLEKAIEHAWMERSLYEQEQVRAEQEAMAEIQRSRNSRSPIISPDTAINSLVMIFTVIAVIWTIRHDSSSNNEPPPSGLREFFSLWPPLAIAVGIFVGVLAFVGIRRWRNGRRGGSDAYEYEFAFRLDEHVATDKVRAYLAADRQTPVASDLDSLMVGQRGGVRIERISADSTLIKLHSSFTFKVGTFARAHFEVVNEILAHKVSDNNQYVLREARIFGDSQRTLSPDEVVDLVNASLDATTRKMLTTSDATEDALALAYPIFREPPVDAVGDPESADALPEVAGLVNA